MSSPQWMSLTRPVNFLCGALVFAIGSACAQSLPSPNFSTSSANESSSLQYVADDDWLAAGGSLENPSAATLVKLGKVKSASDVVTVFSFPAVWDLIVWIKPNPDGAFAYKNPLVKP